MLVSGPCDGAWFDLFQLLQATMAVIFNTAKHLPAMGWVGVCNEYHSTKWQAATSVAQQTAIRHLAMLPSKWALRLRPGTAITPGIQ